MENDASQDLSELPAAYQRWRASELGRITDHMEEELILGLVGPAAGKLVLDVGCGDGVLSVRLAAMGAVVTGVDNSRHMLVAARRRAGEAGQEIPFLEGDAQALPIVGDSFDIIVAVTVLCFIPEPQRAFREIARVLRPGGRVVIGELGRCSSWAAKRRVAGWLGSKTWSAARFRTAGELKKLAVAAGLEVETVCGAAYYPPSNLCARWLSSFDKPMSRFTNFGAAFIALAATKPVPSA